ncbi:MAG: hypothetical protein ACE367_13070 [Acidimicrobiales bacterium]
MTDELDLLSSLNPIPEVRGNPGPVPVPSPGELVAETGAGSGRATTAPSGHDEIGPRHSASGVRGGRSRWALGVVGLAAAVAVVVGIVAATGDDPRRGDQVITSVDDPPPPGPDEGPVDEPDEPPVAEEATATTDPAAEPTEDLAVTDETIPWPDPIVIEVTPETASADRIIEVPAGLVVLEIRGSGWETLENHVLELCESVEIPAGEVFEPSVGITYGCTWTDARLMERSGRFSEQFVADIRTGLQLQLYSTESVAAAGSEAWSQQQGVIARIEPIHGSSLPTLSDASPPGSGPFEDPRIAWVDRVSGRAQVAAEGWDTDTPIGLHACSADADDALLFDSCALVASAEPDSTGSFEAAVPIPDADTRSWRDPAPISVVATQGSRIAMLGLGYGVPKLVDFAVIPEPPGTFDILVRDLRAGERAEIQVCQPECSEVLETITVIGSGTGEDVVAVRLTEPEQQIQLIFEGEPTSWLSPALVEGDPGDVEEAIVDAWPPVDIPPDAPPAVITVEPASVPGQGTYEFTVRGIDWLSAPPVFVLPCDAVVADGLDVELGDACDTSDLTPVTPVDGAFEVTVTYDIGPDGLVIAAGDAAQTQSATATVTVE